MNTSWVKEQARSGTDDTAKSPFTSSKKEKSRKEVVRDDWEDDDEEEDETSVAVEEHNKRIWNEANARESRPMPSVVMSRGASIHSTSSSLPLNEPPTRRILKRPSPSTDISTNANATMGESLQDREARYLAARERIFGTSTADDETTADTKVGDQFSQRPSPIASSPPISSQVLRELRGPPLRDDGKGSSNKGFLNRRNDRSKNPPSKAHSEDTSLR